MSNSNSHDETAEMNDILSSSGGSFPPKLHIHHHHHQQIHGTFGKFGAATTMPLNDDLSLPMVRSMSDASDFRNQRKAIGFGTGTTKIPPGFSSPQHALFTSNSSGISEGTEQSFASFQRSNSNNFPPSSGCEDEDFDLNMVFDEIDALQNKCTDEEAESSDIVTPLTNITSGMSHVHGTQQQTAQSSSGSSTVTGANNEQSPTLNRRKLQASVTSKDGKLITYNSEMYDEQDILLSAEKYSNNVRYLRDFRCEQCPLFLQHKCNQHKPFTCFNWHFANQRRRRPLRKRDGTFNYSPDTYCTKYDETTGICPDGDECLNLHRTAGDTERRYHLRYYKTGMCIYETDSRGFCVKNGAHCAFAHGQHDLRLPVYDIREQASLIECETDANGHVHYEKDRNALNEDPRWQEIAFVLAHYKTDFCKRPQRLCRQGYACPQYHNNKDRRRSPKKFKYRSTPCPSVKNGDEWGDPSKCESEDNCTFCHTRTEQQFHPEIYKSNKCNDIKDSHYCPRGPFCAFAHSETIDDINHAREFATDPNTEFPAAVQSSTSPLQIGRANSMSAFNRAQFAMQSVPSSLPDHFDMSNLGHDLSAPVPPIRSTNITSDDSASSNASTIGPIARPRSYSTSNAKSIQPVTLSMLMNEKQKARNTNAIKKSIGSNMFTNSVFPTLPEQNSFGMSSFNFEPDMNDQPRGQLDDMNMDNFEQFEKFAPLSFVGTPNQNDDSSINSMFRRSSLLNNDNCSSPINIPEGRLAYQETTARSASASGFNVSPPGVIGTSPLDPSFTVTSSFGSRAQQTSPHSMFEQAANIRSMGAEIQRLREENQLQKSRLSLYETRLSQVILNYKRDKEEANQKEIYAEHFRNEAFERMNCMKKEIEMKNLAQSHDFGEMSRQQLVQTHQRLLNEIKCIEDLLSKN